MHPQSRFDLPWLAALTATAVTLLWHGGMFGFPWLWTRLCYLGPRRSARAA